MFTTVPKAKIKNKLGLPNCKVSLRAKHQWFLVLFWILLRSAPTTPPTNTLRGTEDNGETLVSQKVTWKSYCKSEKLGEIL